MQHRLLVKPHPGVSEEDFLDAVDEEGGTVDETITEIGVYVATFNTPDNKRTKIAALNSHRHFKFAEEDRAVNIALTPDDPQFASQTNLTQINAPTAWDSSTGSGVTIAILDTGVNAAHADLADNMVAGYNFYDLNTDTADVRGHGTWVAGVAAAALNNTIGISGVAGDAQIMPLRICDLNGLGYWSAIAKALIYAADNGCRVANCSYENMFLSSSIMSAASYLQNAGGLFVVPAGNTGTEELTPATTTMVVVSSINSDNTFSSFSTYGNLVQVCAPGNGVKATDRGGAYATVWGTSFAAPTVAGVLALMFAANGDLTPQQAMSILNTTATDMGSVGRDKFFGYGKVNAAAAVAAAVALTPAADTTAPTVSISSPAAAAVVSGVVTVSVNAADAVDVDHVEFYVAGVLYAADTLAPWTFTWNTASGADGTKSITAKAYDAAGNVATSAAVSVTVRNVDSTAPVVTISNPANLATVANKNVNIKATATDAVGVVSMSIAIDGVVKATSTNSAALSYGWNVRQAVPGTHAIVVSATDRAGNVGLRSISVTKA